MACHPELVAESEIGNVICCTCGIVSVSCLCTSVRMPSEVFLQFAVMIDEAVASIAAREFARDGQHQDHGTAADA
jgi:hypothetical protein